LRIAWSCSYNMTHFRAEQHKGKAGFAYKTVATTH